MVTKHFGKRRHTDTTEPNTHLRQAAVDLVFAQIDVSSGLINDYLRTLTDRRFQVISAFMLRRVL